MRTVPTLCASSAGIATSALGLSIVTDNHRKHNPPTPSSPTHISTHSRDMSLTTTAIFTFSAASPSTLPSYTFATPEQPQSRRSAAAASAPPQYNNNPPRLYRSVSENAEQLLRSGDRESRASLPAADKTFVGKDSPGQIPERRTWLRRLSSSMSSSRESSRPPTSRSGSGVVSRSNGSVAYSNAGSTAPIFSHSRSLPPNKLVKRSTSTRDVQSSPVSRLPLPTFRRPATSHQRSSTHLEHLSDHAQTGDLSSDGSRDPRWKLYFTSKLARDDLTTQRRRSSSIPNPIKRIYADRRYRPMLVSGREPAVQGDFEYDDGCSSNEASMIDVAVDLDSSVASSPMLQTDPDFVEALTPKRSFSIGDLLATGPQPLWRSPSTHTKALRRTRKRAPPVLQSNMGSMISIAADSDRPSKRRGLANSTRSLHSSSSAMTNHSGSTTPQELHTSESQPASRYASDLFSDQSRSSSADQQRRLPSSNFSSHSTKGTRLSTTTSELTSGADSDSELRSFGDTNTDYQSDTVFDSLPTRPTRSGSGRRGPPIDTIFDETPPNFSSGRSTKLKDFLAQDSFAPMDNNHRYSTIEEEDSVSTPVRPSRDKSIASSPAARAGSRSIFSSSPPTMREMPDPDDIDWDAPDDIRDVSAAFASHSITTPSQQRLPLRFAPVLQPSGSTPQRQLNGLTDKTTIFDWSEVQPSPSHNQSPPRPRTVHGKKDPETRGSRTTARRPVSGMHARSHSVPVVPDLDGKRNNVANKFGTWGVGSKAVTEDWNEDFEFEESSFNMPESTAMAEKRIDSGHYFLVPRSIREQQQNVVANIGLLREWGLLIEELKELRRRAAANNMLEGSFAQAWEEVDAMIELADQETEEHTLAPRRSPPSSPGFDFSGFEDPVPDLPPSMGLGPAAARLPEPISPTPAPAPGITVGEPPVPVTPNRPRKDSEAVARSVIEALRTRRSVSTSDALQPVPTTRKVPFDTATLRHIVPYVNALKRKVKDALRETEGLYRSPSIVRHAHECDHSDCAGDDDTTNNNDDDDDDDEDDEHGFGEEHGDRGGAMET